MKIDFWSNIDTPNENLNANRIDSDHHINFYCAKDMNSNHILIIKDISYLTSIKKIELESLDIKVYESKKTVDIYIKLIDKEYLQLFNALIKDLVESSRYIDKQIAEFVIHRIISWKNMFKNKEINYMSESQIKGLYGELYLIYSKLLSNFSFQDILSFWKGPLGAKQDFEINEKNVEVKTISPNSTSVTISSEEQLYSEHNDLYLYVIGLRNDREGLSLPQLINEILNKIDYDDTYSFTLFNNLLSETGYIYSNYYDKYKFEVISELCYWVNNNFPKITPEQIPSEIKKVKYEVNLLSCESYIKYPKCLK